MKNFIKLLFATICLIVFQNIGMSQTDNHHLHKDANGGNIDKFYLPLQFDADSLVGFDEVAALEQARMNYSEEWMQERFVAVLKRNYIDFHYGYKTSAPNPGVQSPCTNPGFETGTLAGWTALEGPNNNSQTMAGCCAAATTQAVIVGPGADPNVPAVSMVPPGGGNFAVRLGQTGIGGMSYRLNQTFTVTAANSVFVYKYAVILQDGTHTCAEQPFFNIKFETCNNVVIPCAQFQASAFGSGCSSGDPSFITSGAWLYKPWQTRSFDLTAYIGQCVNIEFTVGGCVATQGAHPGYCYIDASCQPMTLNLNGTDIPVGQTTTNMCTAVTNTLCAPPGFTSYLWNGPGGATGNTNQCITTASPGTFSVTLGMQGTSCQSPVLYSTFNLVPKPISNFSFTTTPCQTTFSVPFTDNSSQNGGPALTNWYWDFNNDGITDNLSQSPTNTYTTPGTYSVQLLVSNGGCTDSITKMITVSPSIVASYNNSSGCLNTTTTFTSTSTPTVGITSHVWDFGDGTGTGTGATPSHIYTTPGIKNVTYTVTNASGCSSVITKTLTVYPNPVSSITGNTVCLNVGTTFGNTSSVTGPDVITGWAWDFNNDGVVDNTTQTPGNTYATAGTYTVELKATTNNGCKDSTTIQVKVNPLPTATFTPISACLNNNVVLNNTSSIVAPDNIATYAWNFGVGASPATGSIFNPTPLVYTTPGVKNITLNLTSNNTCTATITQTVNINPQPVANFSTTSVCQGTATAYTDLSTPTGSITAWAWDFTNNGSVDNATNAPTNIFAPSGTYTTNLIVTDNNGCKDTVALPLNVWGHAIPDFSPNNVCFGTASTFSNQTNTTTNANVGGTPTWSWNFGDGSATSAAQDPIHTYTTTGVAVYNVTLTATTLNGCVDNVVKTVTINPLPTATFTPVNACLNNNVALNNTSSIVLPDNIASYAWNFGTGAMPTTTSAVQNPLGLSYTSSGIKNITLTLTSNNTCTATITQTVNIYAQPVANFSTTSVCQGTATAYTDMSTPTGSMIAWAWDFTNNGSVDNATNAPTNLFPTSGTYTTNLIVTDNNGCKDTVALPVNVWGHSIPNFTATSVCFGSSSTFSNMTNTTTNANVGGTPTWSWDFGDGSATNSLQDPTYTYSSTTIYSYSVVLTATTTNGCVDNITKVVTVHVLPTATFTPVNACMNTNVLLNNSSNIALPDNISSYAWDFGTGSAPASTSVVQNPPLLTYNSSGVKTITLTITANTTCTATITNTVTIYPQPVANFSTTSVCQGIATAYTDLSTPTGSITGWSWDFTNNGSPDNATNAPTNIFATSGTFTSGLIVTDNNTCKDTIALPLNVWGHTIPDFTPDKVCFGTNSAFTNLTDETTNPNVGTGSTYVWDFADNTGTTTIVNPNHTYTLGGNANATYNVTLTATSLHNCVDAIVKPVSVYAVPTASFTSDQVCLGNPSHMTDASTGNGNAINAYMWDYLNDGTVDVTGVANPNFVFPAFGNNNVSYTVSTSPVIGLVCSNTTNTIQVWVDPLPVPDFTFVNNCINAQPNTFNGSTSMIAIGTNTAYVWAYGDGAVSTPTTVSTSTHTYAAAGIYNATLTLTSNKGCQSTIIKAVEVYEKPKMLITNSTPCDQAAMTFTATQQAGSGTVTQWYWDFNNSITSIEGNVQNPSFTFAGPGSYTTHLVSETNHLCRDTMTQIVYVNYVPTPFFTVNDSAGCPRHCVTFTDLTPTIPGPASLASWTWDLGDGSAPTINNTNASVDNCYINNSSNQLAQYTVKLTVTTSAGCTSSHTKTNYITVYPKPIANYTVAPNPSNVSEPLVYFTNQSQDYTKWWWMFGDNTPLDSIRLDPEHFYTDATAQTYYSVLLVANQYGCMDTAYVPVEIGPEFTFYIPNAFTPANDDGINDYFTGMGIGIAEYEMWVFDRWGARIFYTDDIHKGWNGKVQGKEQEGKQDVYVWKVRLTDVLGKKHQYIGHVTLLR